ncbi:UDP-N-acetylmuramoyl-L-alanyl-D-glutamate--2,6- diaminopimelate ligase [Chlamydiales bacterium STE3]|nr:UDP-N-acetylmuramoyl-L-alanyl-D-glutamate--2,6- diaminopimelate ligase [Chlamydiales bacterium STE3]
MKLKKLIKDIPDLAIKGPKELEITGICANSKFVSPGNLFIAKKGFIDDGNYYISEAIASGAVAILTDIYDPSLKNVTQLISSKVAMLEGLLATTYYHSPSDDLFITGITGTNGKTTTSFLIKHLLDSLKHSTGLIGTIEYIIGKHRYQATRTTPDVLANQKMLREMLLQNCTDAVMEVTSHALDQGRVAGIEFDVAIFTNLTLDHLDYHKSMDDYCRAKNRLFRQLSLPGKKNKKVAIINLDCPWSSKIIEGCTAHILTYGIENDAALTASEIEFNAQGTKFMISYKGQKYLCKNPLIGRFNIYNCLAAIAALIARGKKIEEVLPFLESLPSVPGRLERVPNSLGINVYVDFAHSDDSLINVLKTLQEVKKGKMITVFGCGGDRDRLKRPKMAMAAEANSDLCIVTSDNPRSEDPVSICAEITKGFADPSKYIVEIDRKKAISLAIEHAHSNDIVLIAGKGHETYQIFAHKTLEFDDRKVAYQICQERS